MSILPTMFQCALSTKKVYDPSQKKQQNDNLSDNQDEWTWKTTKPYVPPITGGKVIKVYDGDTITVATKLPFPGSPVYRFQVRLNGIDAPEMHGTDKSSSLPSRDILSNKILGKNVSLKNVTTEKYGRILADVFFEDQDLSLWMIDSDLAVEYHGGTKAVV